jgi:hypothetical protein
VVVDERWRVIVIRAWRDGDHVVLRVLAGGGAVRHWTAGNVAEGLEILRLILHELEQEGAGETPPITPG